MCQKKIQRAQWFAEVQDLCSFHFAVQSGCLLTFLWRITCELLTGLNTSFSLSLYLSLSAGSQRISDSEFSDYDCEDGIGVISGELH